MAQDALQQYPYGNSGRQRVKTRWELIWCARRSDRISFTLQFWYLYSTADGKQHI